jgi:hypothetical protein
MSFETKCLLALVGIAIVDMVIPIPFAALFLIYVVSARPPRFREMVERVYGT